MFTLQRSYSAKELNHAEGMDFHPVSGEPIRELIYNELDAEFYKKYSFWLNLQFGMDSNIRYSRQGRIGTGKALHLPGESYPEHWKFDPFTGAQLMVHGYD